MNIISIRDMVKSYGEVEQKHIIFKKFTLEIEEHSFNSILGRSGSGKTTLLNIISTLDKCDTGRVKINGYDIDSLDELELNQLRNQTIGFVFQEFNLIDSLSILDNVAIPLLLNNYTIKDARTKAAITLKKVGLNQFLHLRPNELSGGQKQRVAIARAIVNDQKIILCDEPTGALDELMSLEILGLLKELSVDKTVIMVTHDEEYAKKFSDRIIILSDGEIIQDSKPVIGTKQIEKEFKSEKNSLKRKSLFYLSRNSFELSNRNLSHTLKIIIYSSILFLITKFVSENFNNLFNALLFGRPFTAPIFRIISTVLVTIVIYIMVIFSFISFLFIFHSIISRKKKEIAILKAFGSSKAIIRKLLMFKTLQISLAIFLYLSVYLFITLIMINMYKYIPHIFNTEFDLFVLKLVDVIKAIINTFLKRGNFGVTGIYYLKFVFTYLFIIFVLNIEIILSSYYLSREDTISVLARE